jgi:hypothetical protein
MKIFQNKKILYGCYFLVSLFLFSLIGMYPFYKIDDFYYSLFGEDYDTFFIFQSVVAFAFIINYHFGLRIKLFFKRNTFENMQKNEPINLTESSNNIDYTSDINSAQLRIIFKEYSKSFLKLLITVAIGVLNAIGGVLILLSRDRQLIEGYTIFSICISVIVFFVSVFALYNLYIISDAASK